MPYSIANGLKIYYEVSGEGFPFVMVHANPFDHNLWMYQIAHFSTFFKVIAIDIRGYGRSDKPETRFSLKDMADDVLCVCRDEGVTSPGDFQSDYSRRWQQRTGRIDRRTHPRLHKSRHRKISHSASARLGGARFRRLKVR
jgi:hypothetical protein